MLWTPGKTYIGVKWARNPMHAQVFFLYPEKPIIPLLSDSSILLPHSSQKPLCLRSHARLNSEHQLHQSLFCCWWVRWFLLFLPDGRGQHIKLYPAVNVQLGNNFPVTPRDQKVAPMRTLETEPRLDTHFTPARADIAQLKALTHLRRQEHHRSLNWFCTE